MADEINTETFAHLVQLAALELNETEAEYLRGQLNKQLKAIRDLERIPIPDGVPPARHGVPFPAEFSQEPRPDVSSPYPDPEGILAQAPSLDERYFVVPDIPHEKLE